MSGPLTGSAIAMAFQGACLAELDALKPGNVHRFGDGQSNDNENANDKGVADFEASAAAAAPIMGMDGLTVGERIEKAVAATRDVVDHNTNLGIVLLAAPLAQAAFKGAGNDLTHSVIKVLNGLTVDDAKSAYRAIRAAEAGGLGEATEHDISAEPQIGLLDAMRAAAHRDRIAWNYQNNFADIFNLGLRWFRGGMARWGDTPWVTTYVYLGFLAHLPDTLIERKFGTHEAAEVLDEARPLEAGLSQSRNPSEMAPPLRAFDASLKERGLNPGTSADLTVATLFANTLMGG